MKVLITGAKGMLGTDLCQEWQTRGYVLCATDIQDMDIRDSLQVQKTFTDFKPELVLHLAALTAVDGCEREPEQAYRTNTIGTQNVALACQRTNVPLVYISTISIFDGIKCEPYTEFDTPNPKSWYSRAKYEGEKMVERLLQRYYIVRAGWMFGGGKEDKKFVARIIDLAQSRPSLKVVNDKFGSPIYTVDFARAIHDIMTTEQYGIYHAVNNGGPVSRYAVAQAILEFANIQGCELIPVNSAEFPLPAHRPRMEAARNFVMELNGMPKMRHWRDALKEYIQTVLMVD